MFIALACAYAQAQTRLAPEIHHFISLNGDLGYSALLHPAIKEYPFSNGLDAHFGVNHRFYYNNFLMSIGVEASYQLNFNHMKDLDFTIPMRDTEGEFFQMHVIVDNSQDKTHMVNVNVPFLLGGEWKRFYFLVGPKLAFNVYGSASSKAEYTTSGQYGRYYDDFYDMENHQFVTENVMESGLLDIKWNTNFLMHFEIGARIDDFYKHKSFHIKKEWMRMYLSAYVDAGVFNLLYAQKNKVIFGYHETEDKGLQFFIQPLLLSSLANNVEVRNISTGVKFTMAFEIPQKGKSYIYRSENEKRKFKRGGNQIIDQ